MEEIAITYDANSTMPCGSTYNCNKEIYCYQAEKLVKIFDVNNAASLIIMTEKRNNYHNIMIGGSGFKHPVWSFNGKEYELDYFVKWDSSKKELVNVTLDCPSDWRYCNKKSTNKTINFNLITKQDISIISKIDKQEKFLQNLEKIRDLCQSCYYNNLPAIQIAYYDLNHDGNEEIFIQTPHSCGSGGCHTMIFTIQDKNITKIFGNHIAGKIKVFQRKHDKFHDISAFIKENGEFKSYVFSMQNNNAFKPI